MFKKAYEYLIKKESYEECAELKKIEEEYNEEINP
jgi:hypothetical protein